MSDDVQGALREMARSIGALESTVKTLTSTWQQQEQSASSGRRELHQKVDALRADVSAKVDSMRGEMTAMSGQLSIAIRDIAEMKPTVEAVEAAKLQAQGAVTAVRWSSRGFYWLAVGLTLGSGWVLANWLDIKVSLR